MANVLRQAKGFQVMIFLLRWRALRHVCCFDSGHEFVLNRILFSDKASFFIHGSGSGLLTTFDFPLPRRTHTCIFTRSHMSCSYPVCHLSNSNNVRFELHFLFLIYRTFCQRPHIPPCVCSIMCQLTHFYLLPFSCFAPSLDNCFSPSQITCYPQLLHVASLPMSLCLRRDGFRLF